MSESLIISRSREEHSRSKARLEAGIHQKYLNIYDTQHLVQSLQLTECVVCGWYSFSASRCNFHVLLYFLDHCHCDLGGRGWDVCAQVALILGHSSVCIFWYVCAQVALILGHSSVCIFW